MNGPSSDPAARSSEAGAAASSVAARTPGSSDGHPSPVVEAWLNRAHEGFRRMARDPAYLAEVSRRIS